MNIPVKPLIDSIARLRAVHTLPLVFAGVLVLAASAWAQPNKSGSWPTTKWVVMERQGGALTQYGSAGYVLDWLVAKFIPPRGERAAIARKHQVILEEASIWYQSHGFPAPFQRTEDGNLEVDAGEAYLALLKQDVTDTTSSHVIDGEMRLTSNPGILTVDTQGWELMKASAVHELYHGIQKRMMRAGISTEPHKLPGCPGDTDLDWLSEGTAAMRAP